MISRSEVIDNEFISDMTFSRNHAKGSLVVYYKDTVLLFSQINMESLDSIQDESWTLIHKFDNVLNLKSINSIKMEESYYGKLLFIINNKFFLNKTRFITDIDDSILQNKIANLTDDNKRKVSFEGLFTIFQQSKPIYHPQLLKQFYFKGHMKLILKILCKIYELLQVDSKSYRIPNFCELSLDNIINELNLESDLVKPKEQVKQNTNTAASLFDDLFSWKNDAKDSTPLFGSKKTEESKKDPNVKLEIEDEFNEIKEDLVKCLSNPKNQKVTLSSKSILDLIRFVKVFGKIYTKEFYSDKLTDALLRKFNYDKEYNITMEKEKTEVNLDNDNMMIGKTAASRILDSIRAEESNSNLEPWTTMQVAFAFHSKDQDVIFNQVKDDNIDWNVCQKLSIPIWLKETEKLKQLVEMVAKTVYRKAGDDIAIQSKAQVTALWYIMIGKKNMLCNLYRTEPANKKVFELLSNDFSLPRWKKAADNNAMALISKKNYYLSIAFFILAGKVKDAINTALTKCNDINLAICIARLVEGYESEETFNLIDKYLIGTGKEMDDPWLVNIGYWWKQQHIDSINNISSMISESNIRLAQCVFQTEDNFNLYKENAVFKHSDPKDDKKPETNEKSSKQRFEYPIISGRNMFVLDFVHHLMNHHIVKREIKKAEMEESSDEDDDGDIFNDFYGGGGGSKQKEEKKKEQIKAVEVDKEFLLSVISDYYSDKGYSLIGLVLAYENKDIKMSKASADNLVKNIIVEVVKGSKVDNSDSTDKVTKAIDELVTRFSLKKEDYFYFVRNQYRFLENLRLEFRFIKADKDSSTLLFRLEEELMKAINFINVMSSYPFAIDLEKDSSSLKSILSLIEYLEDVVECLFIYENEHVEEEVHPEEDEEEKDKIFELAEDARKPSNTVLANTFNNSLRKDSGSLIKKSSRSKIQVRSTISIKKPGKALKNENSQYMAELCCKLRASYLLHISMILLSFLIKKFEYIRPLLNDLRNLMTYASEKALGTVKKDDEHCSFTNNLQALANIQIYLKNLKEISNSLLSKAKKKGDDDKILNPEYSDEDDANDPFLRNFKTTNDDDELTKKKKVEEERLETAEKLQKKFDEFMILWLRQIVIYNTHYVLHLALANQNMMSTLDVKPSIVKACNIKYALISLINPRLQAFQQVNNFKSMKRVLDNIVSYFFQNFLSLKERGMIVEDLKRVLNNPTKMNS